MLLKCYHYSSVRNVPKNFSYKQYWYMYINIASYWNIRTRPSFSVICGDELFLFLFFWRVRQCKLEASAKKTSSYISIVTLWSAAWDNDISWVRCIIMYKQNIPLLIVNVMQFFYPLQPGEMHFNDENGESYIRMGPGVSPLGTETTSITESSSSEHLHPIREESFTGGCYC